MWDVQWPSVMVFLCLCLCHCIQFSQCFAPVLSRLPHAPHLLLIVDCFPAVSHHVISPHIFKSCLPLSVLLDRCLLSVVSCLCTTFAWSWVKAFLFIWIKSPALCVLHLGPHLATPWHHWKLKNLMIYTVFKVSGYDKWCTYGNNSN